MERVKVYLKNNLIYENAYKVDDEVYLGELPLKGKTIVLDPGHGGNDRANKGYSGKYIEADGTLDIGKKLKVMLKELGAKVILTREKDETLTLLQRGQIANLYKADIFISLHSNAVTGDNTVEGVETYYSIDPYNESKLLAECLLDTVHNICGRKRRFATKRINSAGDNDYYGVLRYSDVPACIVEYGYHSNPKEESLLLMDEFKILCAYATKKGILEYFRKLGK